VKTLLLASIAVLMAMSAAAQECVTAPKTESSAGDFYSVENCVGRVDDVIRTTIDGYVTQYYIVQYKGQRLVVSDPLAQTDRAVGESVSFFVMKTEHPASSRFGASRSLWVQTSFGFETSKEKRQP
jgi:hypothetical protein